MKRNLYLGTENKRESCVWCTPVISGLERRKRGLKLKGIHHWPQQDMTSIGYMRPWRKGVGEEKQGREGKENRAGDLNHGRMSPNIVKNLRTGRSGL